MDVMRGARDPSAASGSGESTGRDGGTAVTSVMMNSAKGERKLWLAQLRDSARGGKRRTAIPGGYRGFISEGDGTRTRNHRIDSPVL